MRRSTGKLWLDTFFPRKTMEMVPAQNLAGKTMVFTGGTDGMGRVAVERFAEMGADIFLFGRNLAKTENLAKELRAAGHKGQFRVVECDLGHLEQVRRAAEEVLSQCSQIDYLINCAGVNLASRTLSPEGYEMNFVVNFLGPFLLTEMLLERVESTPNARIVQLTSATQQVAKLRLDDLHLAKNKWSMLASYAQAKLCLIMHSRDVALRLKGSTATINCLNPGYIQTKITRHSKGFERIFIQLFGRLAAPTWVGGERIVAAALDPSYNNVSGKFIYEDMLLAPNPQALNDSKVSQLIQLARRMTGLEEE